MSSLTTPQLQALKADIQSNTGTLDGKTPAQWWAEGNPSKVAAFYNRTATPDFYVWKSSLEVSEVFDGFIAEDWTAMDNLTVGQDRIWVNLKGLGTLKPASAAHRAALTECWKGTAAKVAVKDRILAMGKRKAIVVEKLLSTGTGTLADPATMGFEGELDWPDVNAAMGA